MSMWFHEPGEYTSLLLLGEYKSLLLVECMLLLEVGNGPLVLAEDVLAAPVGSLLSVDRN